MVAPSAGQAAPAARGLQLPSLSSLRHRTSKRTLHLTVKTAAQHPDTKNPLDRKNIFVFGLGYTSIALANWLAADGWRISGTCRTPARVDGLRAKGWVVDTYDPARGVGLTQELSSQLEDSPYVISSVPPLGLALYDPALSAQKALLRPLAASGRIAWFGYLSSTGVYGDWQGEWVDESSPCRQTSSKAIVRQEAEAAWLQLYEQHGLPAHIFRLGGIYGPGRSVLDTLASEPADLSSSQRRRSRQRYTARCHVYDICAVLAASMAAPAPGRIYNVVDDDPAPRTDIMSYARSLLAGNPADGADHADDSSSATTTATTTTTTTTTTTSVINNTSNSSSTSSSSSAGPVGLVSDQDVATSAVSSQQQQLQAAAAAAPKAEEGVAAAAASDGGGGGGDLAAAASGAGDSSRSRSNSSGREAVLEEKRVRNGRIRGELRVALRYPSYREGLAAIHAGDCWPLSREDLQLLRL
ncbi:hypothetical protein PLESTB_000723900 [Pleodorina starrii]|uniref:Uncharacterized protein n=1 Tax=Pleodorina starrii TaxID=330485 RepID=A0A9W6BJF7_9CHLO|nr:hypothetical protein PLESTM_001703300 [Pleodorina starrii]GLC53244.1 hypothetical protein PLESTB_000723900 [Pleodorina starrii]GLC68122.1 hypothetical protein PLESTF_000648300 [Pleodorina starrii]